VEEVKVDSIAKTVVVKGKAADPAKICERVQKKTGRRVELISPLPPPPPPEEEKKEEPPKEEPPPPPEEKKEEVLINYKNNLALVSPSSRTRKSYSSKKI
jgi:hypothetical protein